MYLLLFFLILIIITVFAYSAIVIVLKYSFKRFVYNKSEYYDQSSFPMQIVYSNNGVYIVDAIAVIQEAISDFNTKLNYKMFVLNLDEAKKYTVLVQNMSFSHGCIKKFDGVGGVLAHATMPPNRVICLDSSEDWNYNRTKLKRVLIHELGHVLGLEHAFGLPSVMSYDNYTELQPYDIENLKTLFTFLK